MLNICHSKNTGLFSLSLQKPWWNLTLCCIIYFYSFCYLFLEAFVIFCAFPDFHNARYIIEFGLLLFLLLFRHIAVNTLSWVDDYALWNSFRLINISAVTYMMRECNSYDFKRFLSCVKQTTVPSCWSILFCSLEYLMESLMRNYALTWTRSASRGETSTK